MKGELTQTNWIGMASIGVGVLTLLFALAVLTGRRVPLISGYRAALVTLWIMGLAMSILAGFRDAPDGKFLMPGVIMGALMLLGVLAALLLVIRLIGYKFPPITGDREAYVALAAIIGAKWVIVHLYNLIRGWR